MLLENGRAPGLKLDSAQHKIIILPGNPCPGAGQKQLSGAREGGFPKDFPAFQFQQSINENVKARLRSNDHLIAPPWKCLQHTVSFMVPNVYQEPGIKWYVQPLGSAENNHKVALYYGAWHQPPRLRERWLSHPSLFVEVSVPRQLMGSGPAAGGGCLDKSLPTSHQKAALSPKLNVSC